MEATQNTAGSETSDNAPAKEKLNNLASKAKGLMQDGKKSVALITAIALVFATVVVIMLWSNATAYRPLYSSTSNYDTSKILEMLDESNIKYQLGVSDGNILVPESRVYEIRKLLAAKGLQEEIPVGMELLSEGSSLGQSQFIEEAKYRYALEGELAKSIVTFEAINYARVHLSIPKTAKYVRQSDRVQATASVVVNLIDGHDLRPNQIDAILNLVAGANASLKTENVSITDQYGRLLSDESTVGDYVLSTSRQQDYRAQVESHLTRQAVDILTPLYGPSNFRVRVNAELDFTQTEETEEIYNEPIVRSESIFEDTGTSQMTLGVPGALSNTPPITDTDEQVLTPNQKRRSEIKRDYAIGSKVVHRKHQSGVVQNISVSVVLNGEEDEFLDLRHVEDLVKNAVGYSETRGDSFTLTQMPFQVLPDLQMPEYAWYEDTNTLSLVRYAVALVLGLVLIFVALRPMVNYLMFGTAYPKKAKASSEEELDPETAKEQQLSEQQIEQEEYLRSLGINNGGFDSLDIDLPGDESPVQDQVKHAKNLVERDPERAIEVLKKWM